MTKKEALDKLRELHDFIKEHPYWNIFDHAMFRNEIKPSFEKMMDIVSYIRYKIEGANDTPFFALHERLFHNFNAVLGRLAYDPKVEESNEFKRYYLVMLQSYLQLVHFFIEGIDDANVLVMYMVDRVYAPHELQKLVLIFAAIASFDYSFLVIYSMLKLEQSYLFIINFLLQPTTAF